MSVTPEEQEKYNILIMEEQVKIAGAEHQKKGIELRIMKRRSEIKRDEEHLALQDKVIEQCRAEIARMNNALKGG